MLAELSEYLRTNHRAALRDLSHRFDTAPEALRGMLETLERRGRVRKLPAQTPCGGGCSSCDPATIEIYEWVD
jgi:Mn-dependent DtxR family transcriptional regulator